MEIKQKICKGRGKYLGLGCGKLKYIFSNGICHDCVPKKPLNREGSNSTVSKDKLKNSTTPADSKEKRGVRKVSGEKVLFDLLFEERAKVSQVSGKPLISDKNHFQFYWQFSHILTKGAYPKYRGLKENIKLVTPEEHDLWEHHKDKIKDDPKWQWVFDKAEQLKSKYHEKSN